MTIDEIVAALERQKDHGPNNLPELIYALALEVQKLVRKPIDKRESTEMTNTRPSIAELQRTEREMLEGRWSIVAESGSISRIESSEQHPDGARIGVAEDLRADDARGIAAIRNAAPVLLEIAAAALEWQTSPQIKARAARNRLLVALAKVRP